MEPQNTPNTQKDTGEGGVDLLSNRIVGCALTVLHALGTGFLENVYGMFGAKPRVEIKRIVLGL
jgi:hypothetical protein